MRPTEDDQIERNPSDTPRLPREESRIIIRPDGAVVIEHLTESLAEVAVELDPSSDTLHCRLEEGHPQRNGVVQGTEQTDAAHHSEGIHSSTKPRASSTAS